MNEVPSSVGRLDRLTVDKPVRRSHHALRRFLIDSWRLKAILPGQLEGLCFSPRSYFPALGSGIGRSFGFHAMKRVLD